MNSDREEHDSRGQKPSFRLRKKEKLELQAKFVLNKIINYNWKNIKWWGLEKLESLFPRIRIVLLTCGNKHTFFNFHRKKAMLCNNETYFYQCILEVM